MRKARRVGERGNQTGDGARGGHRASGCGHACALHFAANAASPELLAAARAAKLIVACYTVNRRDEADALMAAGVASVFSDRPDLWMPEEM